MRRAAVIVLVTGSYAMVIGILLVIVISVTTAFADGWKARAQAATRVDSAPQFSPDGAQIAFVRRGDGPAQVWVMEQDGSDQHPVARATRFSWAGRGALLFARGRRVFRVEADGGAARPARAALLPARLRSGGRTVFVRGNHVYVRDASGKEWELT